jgi:hypothetical protein
MLTISDLVDQIEPFLKRAIETELPFGTRWVALKIARWKIRKVIEGHIALYGHKVSPVLGAMVPLSDRLFRPEVAQKVRDVKGLCDLPVAGFGPAAVEARASAGVPQIVMR